MNQIAVLPPHLANKIAAGEVIERPASVVKELVENAVDAGATRVTVEIEDGGKKMIRIIDNGYGIAPEQLILAVTPHATSKIKNDDDLFSIGTFGFRGEALASISSVSQLSILSRTTDSNEGALLAVRGAEIDEVVPHAAPIGTTISIGNLFFNTPARRKFLKKSNTEMGHISEQFTRLAMANTDVHFILTHNGRILHDLPAGEKQRDRIGKLFTEELGDSLISIHRDDAGIKISGFIAPPQTSRANTQWQYILLNSRFIRDRFIAHAIKEGYRGMMEINRSPIVFLQINVPPDTVDVNVHPAKSEVRFSDSNVIHSHVLSTIREVLLSSDLRVEAQLKNETIFASGEKIDIAKIGQQIDHKERTREAVTDFFTTKGATQSTNSDNQSLNKSIHKRADQNYSLTASSQKQSHFIANETENPKRLNVSPTNDEKQNHDIIQTGEASGDHKAVTDIETVPPLQSLEMPSVSFMQIHDSFIVAQADDGIVIIDQHALHERIMFQLLIKKTEQGPLESQRSLIPETIDVTENEIALIEESEDIFKQLGIELSSFGPRTMAIQSFPILLDKLASAPFVRDLIDKLKMQAGKASKEEIIHTVIDMMSCKAAIKAGDKLTHDEIKSLLAQKNQFDRTSNCPHGRPTTIHLTMAQLEKQFKRT